MRFRVVFAHGELAVQARDTPTAKALLAAMPFESRAQTWGTVCFWTEGDALALPFGRTPISTDERPKLANPCNVLGTIKDFSLLRKVRAGDPVRVEKI